MAGQLLVVDVDARNGGLESMEKLASNVTLAHEAILASGFQVATGSGGGSMHYYFAVPRKLGKMRQALEGYNGIDFKTNGYVVGAGSRHKSGNVYEVDSGSVEGIRPASEALISLLEMPSEGVQWVDDTADILDANMLVSLVDALPNNQASREEWVQVGMALHHATAGQGVELWQRWSAKYPEKHDEGDCFQKWKTFGKYGKRPITIGSLIVRAKEAGWEVPAPPLLWKRSLPKPATMAVEVEEVGQLVNAPIDVSDVDLTDPPDLAGHLCKWINGNSYRVREHLAVAASLLILSCAGGLTHRCDSGVVGNLMAFCVAESGSGKDNVLNCALEALRQAKLGECLYAGIKSEQEMVRNAVNHQLGFYALDEVGSLLKKVGNAQRKGGAAYLEGIMGTLLSITTKGGTVFGLTGDKLAEVKTDLQKRIGALEKGNTSEQRKKDWLNAQLKSIKENAGIVRPFVSVMGFDTPLGFSGLVNDETVGTGFLGRALLFVEHDNAPAKRYRVNKQPLNSWAMARLAQLSSVAVGNERVECLDDSYLVTIHTEDDANQALEKINDYYNDLGFNYDATNSLTPLTNRAHEQVEKVSFVLALGKGRRTLEHVRFAFALVQRDLQTKINLVVANRSGDSSLERLKARVLSVAPYEWTQRGKLLNKVKKAPDFKGVVKLTFDKAIDQLVNEKKLLEKSTERGSKEYKKV
jgi:hypothetical protein